MPGPTDSIHDVDDDTNDGGLRAARRCGLPGGDVMSALRPLQSSPIRGTVRAIDPLPHDGVLPPLNRRCTVDDGNDVVLGHARRPIWRGGIHTIGLIVAIPAVIALLLNSTGGTRLRIGLVVYAVGLCTMLGASATYHRWVHGLKARSTWRRIDHAAIFAAIAGSSTPIVLVALPGVTGLIVVGATWTIALIGACCKLSRWSGGDRAGTALYAVTIVAGTVALPWLWVREGVVPSTFVVVGGVVYLLGAACFAKHWPRLRPTVFSYHEVWHAFTIAAAAAQFVAIWMLAT